MSMTTSNSSEATTIDGRPRLKGEDPNPSLGQLIPIPLTLKQRRELGRHLHIPVETLLAIESDNPGNENKQKRALFKTWLTQSSDVTWGRLLEALGRVDHTLRDQVRDTYNDDDVDDDGPLHGSRQKSHTTELERDFPLSGGTSRPATMPVKSAAKSQPKSPSPESQFRSSSSSYHSASNYDDPDDSLVSLYAGNVEHRIPRSLVQSDKKKTASSGPPELKSRGRPPPSSDPLRHSSHVFSPNHDELPTRHLPPPQSSGSTASATSALAVKQPHTDNSSGQASGRLSPDGGELQSLVGEFREAVEAMSSESVERVLGRGRGVDVDMVINEKDGRSAIMLAAAADQPDMVRTLLRFKASVNGKDKNGVTALYLACTHGNYEVMKLLVTAFADVNAVTNDGTPMLFIPAQKGFSMVTQYLLENDAKPNLANKDGVTPLMAAAKRGQKDVVKVLLANGADVTAISIKSSRTALQEAIDNGHQEIVPLLMSAIKDAKKKSQQLFVCKSAEAVRNLVADNAKVDERRGDEATPLIVQTESGNEEVVKELLLQGANVDLQDNEGESALMKACARGYFGITQLIIAHKAILDLKSRGGYTALMYAVTEDNVGIARELLLAGADPTFRDKNGRTALDIAESMQSEAMIEEIKKHTAIADNKDPFINLLSGYLEKFSSSKQKTATRNSDVTRKSSDISAGSTLQVARIRDEDTPVTEELNKYWKRIADLETRVHDLTLQSTMEITDETDLTYYDRNRLESEFRKLKELKHKAEQYAVEAKQTAQRLSAENFKLKEDLSRERHIHELERKNLLREMEARIGKKGVEDEREETKKQIMELTIHQRATQLAHTMGGEASRVQVDCEMIKELILNQTVSANLVLLLVAGLPYSGKSTVIRNVINASEACTVQEMRSLSALKSVVLRHSVRSISQWKSCNVDPVLLVAISLLRVSLQKHPFPDFPNQSSPMKTASVFDDSQLDQFFGEVFNNFPLHMMNDENVRWMLTTGDVSFVNVWDVGMNKAVFDILGMLVPDCENSILVNFLSLDRDADSINEKPRLGDPCYKGRYGHRDDDQELLSLRSKLEYLCYPMFVVPSDSSVLVATHSGLIDAEVKRKTKEIQQKVKMHVDSLKESHSSLNVPQVVPVAYRKDGDTEILRHTLEEIIAKKGQFRVELSLKWVFLRTFLASTNKLYITLPEVRKYAKLLHITDGEIADFLRLFTKCGSFIHVGGICPECADEFIILKPADFVHEVEKLYYDTGDVDPKLKENREKGYVSKEFARALWAQSKSGPFERSGFFIHTLRRLGLLAPLLPKNITTNYTDSEVFFMPRIRPKACNTEAAHDSLFLTHSVVFPFPLQSEFVQYFQRVLTEFVEFNPMDCFNTLRFKNITGVGSEHLTLHFMEMGGYIEVSGKQFNRYFRSVIKTSCIEVMAGIQRKKPKLKLEYSLAVMCPYVDDVEHEHFIRIHALETANTRKLFCYKCQRLVAVEGGCLEWVCAPYSGPISLVQGEEDHLPEAIRVEIADSLSLLSTEELVDIAADLGFSEAEVVDRLKYLSQKSLILELLSEYSKRTPHHVRRRLEQLLLNKGHLTEALKIYPMALQSCLYNDSLASDANHDSGFTPAVNDRPSLRELRLVAMHMERWEAIGKDLGIDQATLEQCRKSHRTMCEMAYQMLVKWRETGEGRSALIRVLDQHNCESNAEFLKTGEVDHYWK